MFKLLQIINQSREKLIHPIKHPPFSSHRLYTPFHEESQRVGDKLYDAVRNALILLVVVIVLTIVLIILYKKRCYKVMCEEVDLVCMIYCGGDDLSFRFLFFSLIQRREDLLAL